MIRLNKYIAQSGVCSRREADALITTGRVSVNGAVARELGTKIDPINDKVKVDGNRIKAPELKTYIMFYKPRGILSSMSNEKNSLIPFIADMGAPGLFHVGRLDRESEGLLLLTNDGDWADRISHPRYGIRKEYEIELDHDLVGRDEAALLSGIDMEDGLFKADQISMANRRRFRISIHDGRNRILRRVFEHLGYEVLVLKRVAVGGLKLGNLRPGDWKEISDSTI